MGRWEAMRVGGGVPVPLPLLPLQSHVAVRGLAPTRRPCRPARARSCHLYRAATAQDAHPGDGRAGALVSGGQGVGVWGGVCFALEWQNRCAGKLLSHLPAPGRLVEPVELPTTLAWEQVA